MEHLESLAGGLRGGLLDLHLGLFGDHDPEELGGVAEGALQHRARGVIGLIVAANEERAGVPIDESAPGVAVHGADEPPEDQRAERAAPEVRRGQEVPAVDDVARLIGISRMPVGDPVEGSVCRIFSRPLVKSSSSKGTGTSAASR